MKCLFKLRSVCSLPKINCIRMVELWFIFILSIPVLEVILHSKMERIRSKAKELPAVYNEDKQTQAWQVEAVGAVKTEKVKKNSVRTLR